MHPCEAHAASALHPQIPFSHRSIVHESVSSQMTGGPATHAPDWQVSSAVQASPSSQELPLVRSARWLQVKPSLHRATVQALPSVSRQEVLDGTPTKSWRQTPSNHTVLKQGSSPVSVHGVKSAFGMPHWPVPLHRSVRHSLPAEQGVPEPTGLS